jgi:hypothetical protein
VARENKKASRAMKFMGAAFIDALTRVRSNKKTVLIMMGIDALFLLSLVLLNLLAKSISPDPMSMIGGAGKIIAAAALSILVYFALAVVLYSFFKFSIMRGVRSLFGSKKTGYSMFSRFLLLNILLLGLFSAVFIILSLIFITTIRLDALATVRDVFYTLLAISAYISINTAHASFMDGKGVMQSAKAAFGIMLGRPKAYLGIAAFTITASAALSAAYYAIDWGVLKIIGDAIKSPGVFLAYAAVNTAIIAALALAVLAFNKAYFYSITIRESRRGGVEKGDTHQQQYSR